jgi:hypothetical protein
LYVDKKAVVLLREGSNFQAFNKEPMTCLQLSSTSCPAVPLLPNRTLWSEIMCTAAVFTTAPLSSKYTYYFLIYLVYTSAFRYFLSQIFTHKSFFHKYIGYIARTAHRINDVIRSPPLVDLYGPLHSVALVLFLPLSG